MNSVAPGGGFTITGVGDDDTEELLATTGADTVGDGECFVGVACGGVGAMVGSLLVGAPSSGVNTGVLGVNEAALADAADAD
jgi:hypothetical protein